MQYEELIFNFFKRICNIFKVVKNNHFNVIMCNCIFNYWYSTNYMTQYNYPKDHYVFV